MVKRVALAFLTTAALVLAGGPPTPPGPPKPPKPPKVAKDINTSSAASVNILVKYNNPPQNTNLLGGAVQATLTGLLNTVSASLPGVSVPLLAADPNVDYITLDHPLNVTGAPTWIGSLPDYGWETIGANQATSVFGLTGKGIGVAVIDSGIDNLDDLKDATGKSRIVYSQSFVPGDPATGDEFGHGDHVAGILGGTGKDSSCGKCTYTIRGIAPGVNFINLKVLNKQGQGSDSAVITAIATAIALKPVYNIRVINLSLGRPVGDYCANDLLCQSVQAAWQAGIVVVAAAGNGGRDDSFGNNGYGTITVPGNNPAIITVGATNTNATLTRTDDIIASYSSKGPTLLDHVVKPDLVAPGNQIFSLDTPGSWLDANYGGDRVPQSVYQSTNGGAAGPYFVLSGTSMATPMVSGAAALMVQQDPTLTPDQIKARLMLTADKFSDAPYSITDPATGQTFHEQNDIFTVGAGYVDIPAALSNTEKVGSPAVSPTAVPDDGAVTLTFPVASSTSATNVLWGSGNLWGANVVWGSNVLSGSNVLWGSSAVWGQSSVSGSNVLWGSSVPTGDSDDGVGAENVLWGSRNGGSQGDPRR